MAFGGSTNIMNIQGQSPLNFASEKMLKLLRLQKQDLVEAESKFRRSWNNQF